MRRVSAAFPVFDAHIHVGPYDLMNEQARLVMLGGRDDVDLLTRVGGSADELLKMMDAQEIARAALITSVAPDVIGITDAVNPWIARYVEGHRDRLVPVGGIHPRHSRDVTGDVRRMLEVHRLGAIKLHPPHMEMAANAYRTDCPSLAEVYRLAGEARRPVYIHTGTSVFPGARNVYADPMACDDVAVDFPQTTLVLCHAGRPIWYDTAFFLAAPASQRPARRLEHPAEKASRRPPEDFRSGRSDPVGNRLAVERGRDDAPERRSLPLSPALGLGQAKDPLRQRGGALSPVAGKGSTITRRGCRLSKGLRSGTSTRAR